MRNIKLTIEYDGTHFQGWQVQLPKFRTIQDEIKKVLQKLFKEPVLLIGSGRTDSGVHALGQVANFKTNSSWDLDQILKALNGNLPQDISVVRAEEVPLNFHSQFSVKSKTYRYTILNRPGRSALYKNFCYFFPIPLNVTMMRKAAKILIGTHDFKSFQGTTFAKGKKGQIKSSVRTIKRLVIKKEDGLIHIDIEANGFLYKMVRNIVGTLVEVGKGKLTPKDVSLILKKKDRTKAPATSLAKGLCLMQVKY